MLKGNNKLFLFRFPTTTDSVFEFKEKVENCKDMNQLKVLLNDFDDVAVKSRRPHVLYQIGEDGSFHGQDTRFLAIPCTTKRNKISSLEYNEAFFYQIKPKSFAKIYELTVLKLDEQKDLQNNDIAITSQQYADIGNACVDYIETIIKENINMVNQKTSMQLLIESNANLEKSSEETKVAYQEIKSAYKESKDAYQEIKSAYKESKDAYDVLLNRFDALLEAVEEQGLDLSNNSALNA